MQQRWRQLAKVKKYLVCTIRDTCDGMDGRHKEEYMLGIHSGFRIRKCIRWNCHLLRWSKWEENNRGWFVGDQEFSLRGLESQRVDLQV